MRQCRQQQDRTAVTAVCTRKTIISIAEGEIDSGLNSKRQSSCCDCCCAYCFSFFRPSCNSSAAISLANWVGELQSQLLKPTT